MKKLLWLLLLFPELLWAQAQVVVSGTITGATSGYVQFVIQPSNSGIQYYVQGVAIIAPQTTTCAINSGGQVVGPGGSGSCQVWGNDVISPANTLYQVVFAPGGTITNRVNRELITGATYSLNSPKFGAVVQLVPQFQTFTAPPLSTNVTPQVNNQFNLGDAGHYFSSAYISTLFVNTIIGGSQSSPTMLSLVNGSAISPSLNGLNFPTTGIYWASGNSDNLYASVNGGLNFTDVNSYGFGIGTSPAAQLHISNPVATPFAWTSSGIAIRIDPVTYTDEASSGTVAVNNVSAIDRPTLAASLTTTYTTANTFYIDGPPIAGLNVTLTNPYALYVNSGAVNFPGFTFKNNQELVNNGAASVPSYAFTAHPGTGWYSDSSGFLYGAVNGTKVVEWNLSGLVGPASITGVSGTFAFTANGAGGAGTNFGLEVNGGTNSSDYAFLVNANSIQGLGVRGDNAVVMGSSVLERFIFLGGSSGPAVEIDTNHTNAGLLVANNLNSAGNNFGVDISGGMNSGDFGLRVTPENTATAAFTVRGDSAIIMSSLTSTGSATGKKVVCVDTSTGILYASSATNSCAN